MSKPTMWKCKPCDLQGVRTMVVSGQPETGRRVKIVDEAGCRWANDTYGMSLTPSANGNTSGGSAVPMCAAHYAGYLAAKRGFLDGDRAKSRNTDTSAVTVAAVKAHEAGDEAAAAAAATAVTLDRSAWHQITSDDMRWINRAAYGQRARYADTAALYDAMIDAYAVRLSEWAGRNGGTFPTGDDRTRMLQGLTFGVAPTSKGESVQVNGTRVYGLISLDAVSGDEDEHGATLADTLADASDEYDRQDMLALAREYADHEGEAGEAARALLAEYAA